MHRKLGGLIADMFLSMSVVVGIAMVVKAGIQTRQKGNKFSDNLCFFSKGNTSSQKTLRKTSEAIAKVAEELKAEPTFEM